MSRAATIIAAAGRGARMGADYNKIFLDLAGVPLLARTLKPFVQHPRIDQIVIVSAQPEMERVLDEVVCHLELDTQIDICAGGESRQASVYQGLLQVNSSLPLVLVHDGARPLVSVDLIDRVLHAAERHGAALPGVPASDSLWRVDHDERVTDAVERAGLYRSQTPQGFQREILQTGLEAARQANEIFTDEVGAVRRFTETKVRLVEGDPNNLKVTTPADLAYARWLLGNRTSAG